MRRWSPQAARAGWPPPGTTTANGSGTSSKLWLGASRTTESVGRTSSVSPTTTTSKLGSMRGSADSTCKGPTRSSGVSPGYRTKAIVLESVAVIWSSSLRHRGRSRRDQTTPGALRRAVSDLARHERRPSLGLGEDPLHRQPVLDPLLLAAHVHGHGRVAELLEPAGHRLAARARLRAVHDDRPSLVREEDGREGVDVARRDVERSGKVGVGVEAGAQRFHEGGALPVGHAPAQGFTGDVSRQRISCRNLCRHSYAREPVARLSRRHGHHENGRAATTTLRAVEFGILGPLEVRAGS